MSESVFTVAFCVVGLVCGMSATVHLFRHRELRVTVARQGVFSVPMTRLVALTITAAELLIAVGTLLCVFGVVHSQVLAVYLMISGAIMFAGFATYLRVVRDRHGDARVPCGCGVGDAVITSESVWRAVALTGISLLAVVGLLWRATSPDLGGEEPLFTISVVAASITVSNVVIWLPITFLEHRLLEEAIT